MPNQTKVPQEFWSSYIIEKLRRRNPHLALAFDESKFVKGGSIVYIPQAGAKPNVVKNRNTFPAVAVQRGDSAVLYPLDTFSTDPTHVTWAEGMEISYNKQDSVLGDHSETLVEAIGEEMIYNWIRGFKPDGNGGVVAEFLPASNIVKTTGEEKPVNSTDGQAGNRRSFVAADLSSAQALMNKQGVPIVDRYAMIESYMYQQLMDSLTNNQMHAFEQTADLKNGILGRLYGFSILERSSVLAINEAHTTFKVPGEALADSDNLGALCWQKNCVAKSTGDIVLFQDENNPLYYGDIYSGLVKMGGRARREDWAGIVVIAQDNA